MNDDTLGVTTSLTELGNGLFKLDVDLKMNNCPLDIEVEIDWANKPKNIYVFPIKPRRLDNNTRNTSFVFSRAAFGPEEEPSILVMCRYPDKLMACGFKHKLAALAA